MNAAALAAALAWLVSAAPAAAGFVDEFNGAELAQAEDARGGWAFFTGDGDARITLSQQDGSGRMRVDSSADARNIWWAVIRRSVSGAIDAHELARPDRELRIEARIRTSIAPRRINLHVNHSRTTDFHSHLMEFDLPDTAWRVISFTTSGFDAEPEDEVFVQAAMIDWGHGQFGLDIDYIKVDVVDPARSPPLGEPLPYRPPLPPSESFALALPAQEAAIIDSAYPDVSFAHWSAQSEPEAGLVLPVSPTQTILLRWDFSSVQARAPHGWGVLELTTHSAQWADTGAEEFAQVRVVEILGGDENWARREVTQRSFMGEGADGEVLNGQMIIDAPVNPARGAVTRIAVSPPVLRRLISGRTKGLAITAQGAIFASFYSGESDPAGAPMLRFNLTEPAR
jgi:hypothetical protein